AVGGAGTGALGGADGDRHGRKAWRLPLPTLVAEAVVGVSSPAVTADQCRRRACFPCGRRGRRLAKKAADVGRTLDARGGNWIGGPGECARAGAARGAGGAGT